MSAFITSPMYIPNETMDLLVEHLEKNKDATDDENSWRLPREMSSRPFTLPVDLSCPWCSRLDVRVHSLVGQKFSEIPVGKHTYHCLSHSVCRQRERGKSSVESACNFCRHLDLYHVIHCFVPLVLNDYTSPTFGGVGQVAAEIGLATDWYCEENLEASCKLCQFVKSIVGAQTNLPYVKFLFRVRMYSTEESGHGNLKLELHLQHPESEDGGSEELLFKPLNEMVFNPTYSLDRKIDWKLVNSWLGRGTAKEQKLLPGFRVIDVQRNCIFQPQRPVDYVTLSYVWGQSPVGLQALKENIKNLEEEGSLLHEDIPATIKDAMTACIELGQRYLWVDRLCILQDDDTGVKLELIEHMDAVYGSSAFTIVAASGEDARSGLSGVSQQREVTMNVLRWQYIELSQRLPRLHQIVAKSQWNTRGWTFQEAMCSKNCLYFTDYGVFLSDQRGRVVGERASSQDTPRSATGYFSAVEKYTRRTLKDSKDRLRAFIGVLNHLIGDRHFHGLPLDMFTEAILWEPTTQNCNKREHDPEQIVPSWSWASIGGAVRYTGIYAATIGSFPMWGSAEFGQDHAVVQPVASWALPPSSQKEQLSALPFRDKEGLTVEGLPALAWDEGILHQKYFEWVDPAGSGLHIWLRHKGHPEPEFLEEFSSKNREDAFSGKEKGRVLVFTHSTELDLELIPDSDGNRRAFLLRTTNGDFAGIVRLTTSEAGLALQNKGSCVKSRLEFLAVALMAPSEEDSMRNALTDIKLYLQDATNDGTEVTAQCGVHEDPQDETLQKEAWKVYEKELRYNDGTEPPRVQVMLITRKAGDGEDEDGVASRLGIGTVYLKRWVQSNPKFVTAALE